VSNINQCNKNNIHLDHMSRIKKPIPDLDSPNYGGSWSSSDSESEQLSTSEHSSYDQILDNCEEFLQTIEAKTRDDWQKKHANL